MGIKPKVKPSKPITESELLKNIDSGEKLRGNKDVASKQPRRVGAIPTPATSDDAQALADEIIRDWCMTKPWWNALFNFDSQIEEWSSAEVKEIVKFAISATREQMEKVIDEKQEMIEKQSEALKHLIDQHNEQRFDVERAEQKGYERGRKEAESVFTAIADAYQRGFADGQAEATREGKALLDRYLPEVK